MNRYKLHNIAILVVAILIGTVAVNAQSNSTESPYSRYGLGRLNKRYTNYNRSQGGLGIGIRNGKQINPLNPAAYSSVDSMTFIFDFAASIGGSFMNEGNNSDSRMIGNFDYASVLFPVGKSMAISGGLMPYSTVGYRYAINEKLSNNDQYVTTHTHQGRGQLSEVYLGISAQPLKHWSLGINGGFIFGTLSNNQTTISSVPNTKDPTFSNQLTIRGFNVKAGTQAMIPLGDRKNIIIGATFSPRLALKSTEKVNSYFNKVGSAPEVIRLDTITSREKFFTPMEIGAGLSYNIQNKLTLGLDFHYDLWTKSFVNVSDEYQGTNRWQVIFGGSYINRARSINYKDRIEYRWGANFANSYPGIKDTQGRFNQCYQTGVSCGVGLPLTDGRSYVDLTLEYDRLIPTGALKLTEQTILFTLGLRFNEGWFKKLQLN